MTPKICPWLTDAEVIARAEANVKEQAAADAELQRMLLDGKCRCGVPLDCLWPGNGTPRYVRRVCSCK